MYNVGLRVYVVYYIYTESVLQEVCVVPLGLNLYYIYRKCSAYIIYTESVLIYTSRPTLYEVCI